MLRHSQLPFLHRARPVARVLGAACVGLPLLAGCGTLSNGRGWGQDATLLPGRERLGRAAKDAALDPWTWVPLAGAAVLTIDDWDQRVSSWARKETPVFGSTNDASDASDTLRDGLFYGMIATSLATASGEEPGTWAWSKTKGVGLSMLAATGAEAVTVRAKGVVDRERPTGANRRSFPSKHATNAFSYARWTSQSLEAVEMSDELRMTLQLGVNLTAAGASWARVEAGHHYPADILAGAALGNFFSRFVEEAFLGLPETVELTVEPAPEGDGLAYGLTWRP